MNPNNTWDEYQTYSYADIANIMEGYKFRKEEESIITFMVGSTEMLKVTPDGFYVRGVRVEADDREAKTVYEAFKAHLAWAELNRR